MLHGHEAGGITSLPLLSGHARHYLRNRIVYVVTSYCIYKWSALPVS